MQRMEKGEYIIYMHNIIYIIGVYVIVPDSFCIAMWDAYMVGTCVFMHATTLSDGRWPRC